LASGLAGGAELRFGAIRPRGRARGVEERGGCAQVWTCLHSFPLTAQPLAVKQFGTGALKRREGVSQAGRFSECLIWRTTREQCLATGQKRATRIGGRLKYPALEPTQRRLYIPRRSTGPHGRFDRVRC
jgi:hypothetical protein